MVQEKNQNKFAIWKSWEWFLLIIYLILLYWVPFMTLDDRYGSFPNGILINDVSKMNELINHQLMLRVFSDLILGTLFFVILSRRYFLTIERTFASNLFPFVLSIVNLVIVFYLKETLLILNYGVDAGVSFYLMEAITALFIVYYYRNLRRCILKQKANI